MTSASNLARRAGREKRSAPHATLKRNVIYLACPYSDPDKRVREQRFQAATKAAAHLIRQGYIVYSPITMTHPIDIVLGGGVDTLGSDYWVKFDEAFMDFCAEMVILNVPGWDKSQGIEREIEYFVVHGKSVRLMQSDGSLNSIDPERGNRR